MQSIENKEIMKKIEEKYLSDPDNFVLIEIGANDGSTCDRMNKFILKYNPKCILIEPIPCYFEELKKMYKNITNSNFENIAIDLKKGENFGLPP